MSVLLPIGDKEECVSHEPREHEAKAKRGEGRGKESRREVLVGTASEGSPESFFSHIHTETTLFIVQTGVPSSFEINFNEI